MQDQANNHISNYSLDEHIGSIELGEMYRITKTKNGERFLLLALHPAIAAQPEIEEELEDLIHHFARVDHPNIVPPRALISLQRTIGILCDNVSGQSLDSVSEQLNFQFENFLTELDRIISALVILHANRIFHGDLEPKNVLIQDENPKILWAGIMPLLDPEVRNALSNGSPFVAPEIRDISDVQNNTDIFSLGMLIADLLSEQPLSTKLADLASNEAFYENIDSWLQIFALDPIVHATIVAMLQINPGRRPRIASDVRFALIPRGAFGRKPLAKRNVSPQQKPRTHARKRRKNERPNVWATGMTGSGEQRAIKHSSRSLQIDPSRVSQSSSFQSETSTLIKKDSEQQNKTKNTVKKNSEQFETQPLLTLSLDNNKKSLSLRKKNTQDSSLEFLSVSSSETPSLQKNTPPNPHFSGQKHSERASESKTTHQNEVLPSLQKNTLSESTVSEAESAWQPDPWQPEQTRAKSSTKELSAYQENPSLSLQTPAPYSSLDLAPPQSYGDSDQIFGTATSQQEKKSSSSSVWKASRTSRKDIWDHPPLQNINSKKKDESAQLNETENLEKKLEIDNPMVGQTQRTEKETPINSVNISDLMSLPEPSDLSNETFDQTPNFETLESNLSTKSSEKIETQQEQSRDSLLTFDVQKTLSEQKLESANKNSIHVQDEKITPKNVTDLMSFSAEQEPKPGALLTLDVLETLAHEQEAVLDVEQDEQRQDEQKIVLDVEQNDTTKEQENVLNSEQNKQPKIGLTKDEFRYAPADLKAHAYIIDDEKTASEPVKTKTSKNINSVDQKDLAEKKDKKLNKKRKFIKLGLLVILILFSFVVYLQRCSTENHLALNEEIEQNLGVETEQNEISQLEINEEAEETGQEETEQEETEQEEPDPFVEIEPEFGQPNIQTSSIPTTQPTSPVPTTQPTSPVPTIQPTSPDPTTQQTYPGSTIRPVSNPSGFPTGRARSQ